LRVLFNWLLLFLEQDLDMASHIIVYSIWFIFTLAVTRL